MATDNSGDRGGNSNSGGFTLTEKENITTFTYLQSF